MMEDISSLDKEYILHTYNRKNIAFTRGDGARLFAENGDEFIDFTSGIGVCSLGHANKRLCEALSSQLQNITHTSNLYLNANQALLAKKLVDLSGYDMRVFFSNSGCEANECAIKIARKYGFSKGKSSIITLESSFHGRTLATLKATGQPKMHHKYFAPYPDGFVIAKDIDDIYNVLDEHTCAVMIELIQGEGGINPMDISKVRDLEKFLKSRGVLLIVDEVQSGIYRSGELFASHIYKISPEIITIAKGLGGGIPIGATMTSLKDIFEIGDHGSTFGGNFFSTRAGLEVLNILSEFKDSGQLDIQIKLFNTYLDKVVSEYKNLFLQKVGMGLMLGLKSKSDEIQGSVIDGAFENKLLVLKSGRGVVRFLPSLTISKDEIEDGFDRFFNSLRNIG